MLAVSRPIIHKQPTFIVAARQARELDACCRERDHATHAGRRPAGEPGVAPAWHLPLDCLIYEWTPCVAAGARAISSSAWLDCDRSW